MTKFGIDYMANVETARHNQAMEQETNRSNLVNESIGKENAAANTKNAATNQKQLKINKKNARSQARSSRAQMKAAKASAKQAKTAAKKQKEDKRSHKAQEKLKQKELNINFTLGQGGLEIAHEKNIITKELGKRRNAIEAYKAKKGYKLGKESNKIAKSKIKTDYKKQQLHEEAESKRSYAKINADRARAREANKTKMNVATSQNKTKKNIAKYEQKHQDQRTLSTNIIKSGDNFVSSVVGAAGKAVGAASKGG